MSLQLIYSSPEKVDKREDWQKSGRYRVCYACVDFETGEILVCYGEWGTWQTQYVHGFKSFAAAQLYARGMNIKGR